MPSIVVLLHGTIHLTTDFLGLTCPFFFGPRSPNAVDRIRSSVTAVSERHLRIRLPRHLVLLIVWMRHAIRTHSLILILISFLLFSLLLFIFLIFLSLFPHLNLSPLTILNAFILRHHILELIQHNRFIYKPEIPSRRPGHPRRSNTLHSSFIIQKLGHPSVTSVSVRRQLGFLGSFSGLRAEVANQVNKSDLIWLQECKQMAIR